MNFVSSHTIVAAEGPFHPRLVVICKPLDGEGAFSLTVSLYFLYLQEKLEVNKRKAESRRQIPNGSGQH